MPAELARKKPIIVEAFTYTGDNGPEIADWAGTNGSYNHFDGLQIDTPQGLMKVHPTDRVIHGTLDQYYPVDEETYLTNFEKVNGP